jgi:hypothetical protein
MPGTSPGMTTFDMMPHSIGRILSQTLRTSGHPPCRLLESPDTPERGMPPAQACRRNRSPDRDRPDPQVLQRHASSNTLRMNEDLVFGEARCCDLMTRDAPVLI